MNATVAALARALEDHCARFDSREKSGSPRALKSSIVAMSTGAI